jgi:hypothetical protein
MKPTITENSALYFAQHKISKQRSALFYKLRTAIRPQGPDLEPQRTFGKLFFGQRLYRDNGR